MKLQWKLWRQEFKEYKRSMRIILIRFASQNLILLRMKDQLWLWFG